jgi:DNA (cytosine-5)-methyltransferase 1
MNTDERTLGSLFAGCGGFDCGFDQAGWRSVWQVEIDATNRAVLADRFPGARQLSDVRNCGARNLERVACIAFGSPCTDISNMGGARKIGKPGLDGEASGLFFEALRIIGELQPPWVVFENVPALLHSNGGRDFERVVAAFAQLGYLGFGRVLNAQFFGVPQRRRRLFLVAGLGRYPSLDFLADASAVEAIPSSLNQAKERAGDCWAGYTLTAADSGCRIDLGSELFVAEEDGWDQMVERARAAEIHGFLWGLDEAGAAEAFAAGNAVCPPVARWIAEILNRS